LDTLNCPTVKRWLLGTAILAALPQDVQSQSADWQRVVDVLLPTQPVEPPRGSDAIAPRICQLAVLDVLFSRVGHFCAIPGGEAQMKLLLLTKRAMLATI
jgi:hypothetical protein